MVDTDPARLEVSRRFGATDTVDASDGKAAEAVMALTGGRGVDVAVEAVGIPATFDTCQSIIAPGGHIANVGVHGKPVELHLETLWIKNITLTTGLVCTDSTPMLLQTVASGKVKPEQLVTHRFALDDVIQAYEVFGNAAREKAMKVVLKAG
jgi:alcohol dehydrogenase